MFCSTLHPPCYFCHSLFYYQASPLLPRPHRLCAQRRARYHHSVKLPTFGHRCSSSTSPCGSVAGRTTSIFVFSFSSPFIHLSPRILVPYYLEFAYKNPRTWPHQRQANAVHISPPLYFACFRSCQTVRRRTELALPSLVLLVLRFLALLFSLATLAQARPR